MNYKIAYSACQGTAHLEQGMPCQDAVAGHYTANGAVIVLADGAGSCQFAELGANTVTQAVEKLLSQWCDDSAFDDSTLNTAGIIKCCTQALAQNMLPLEEQACTLLFCAVRGDGAYILGHIGDGYAFFVDGEESQLLSDAENGETLNETYFITGPTAEKHLRLQTGTLQPGQAVILCSDGAGDALFDRQTRACAGAVGLMARWLQAHPEEDVSAALTSNMDAVMRSRTFDDMSIALLTTIKDL